MTFPALNTKGAVTALFFLLFLGSFSMGQSVKSSWSKYEKGNYEDAEEGFRKILCENPEDILANLGKGLVCSNNSILDNPLLKNKYDLFEAFRCIRKSKKGMGKLRDGELLEINKEIKSIPDVMDKVNKEYDKIEVKIYNQVMLRKNLDSAEIFIYEFPDSKYYKDVLQIRNNQFFNKVKGSHSVSALDDFIERCPEADSIHAAILLRDRAAFDTLTKTRTLEGVYDYLNRYPNSRQYKMVIGYRDNLESEKALKDSTIEAYTYFFDHFPKSSKAPVLLDKFIELSYLDAKKQNSLEYYTEFLDKFPLAKAYAGKAREKRDSLCFTRFSETVDSLNKYITAFPASKFLDQAVRLRDQKAYENAAQVSDIASFEQFIYRYPAALEVKEALAMRDSLVFEQVKFMSSEKEFFNFLADYPYLIHQPKTLQVLEEVLYREAKNLDNADYYQEFINRYPQSAHLKEMQDLLRAK